RHLAVDAPRLARIVNNCCYPRSRTFEGHDRPRRRGFVTQLGFWRASAVDQSAYKRAAPEVPSPTAGSAAARSARGRVRHSQVVLDFVGHPHVFADGPAKTRPRLDESSEVAGWPHSQHVLDRTLTIG